MSPSHQSSTNDLAVQGLSEPARRIRSLSIERWGTDDAVEIVGTSEGMVDVLNGLAKISGFDEPVLILGESGVGKELLARATYLLGDREPFVSVNCPQFLEGNLTVSELFGHRKGSFTGAVADRKGAFETADGGVIFLDEIGDLHMSAQMMLLRALATGEFQPIGADGPRRSNTRVIAATNRSLTQLTKQRHFRLDLLFRLRYFLFNVPPLRDRGDDWELLVDHLLERLHRRYGVRKRMSAAALELLSAYPWPGNVRELHSIVTAGYALADGDVIEPSSFADSLEQGGFQQTESKLERIERALRTGKRDFWEVVHRPFLDRDLNRAEVRHLVSRGLRGAGSYRDLLEKWSVEADEYHRFMGFLRHHRLKPSAWSDSGERAPDEE